MRHSFRRRIARDHRQFDGDFKSSGQLYRGAPPSLNLVGPECRMPAACEAVMRTLPDSLDFNGL